MAQIRHTDPATHEQLQQVGFEYRRLHSYIQTNSQLLDRPRDVQSNQPQVMVGQGGHSAQLTPPCRPQSAPPISQNGRHRPIPFPFSRLGANQTPQSIIDLSRLTPPMQQPPLPTCYPRALRRQRRDFRAMDNKSLLDARYARSLGCLDVLGMDEEIAFRVLRHPDQWGLFGQLVNLSAWGRSHTGSQ